MSRVRDFINRFFAGNVAEIMDGMSYGMANLTVANPPYDNLRDCKGYRFDARNMLQESYQATRLGGVVVWVVSDKTKGGVKSLASLDCVFTGWNVGTHDHTTIKYRYHV